MELSVKDQIGRRCIHFTGLMDKSCKKGIEYDTVKDKTERPFRIPCLRRETLNGGNCGHCEFPSKEQVEKKAKEIEEMITKTIGTNIYIKEHARKTGQNYGTLDCLECDGKLSYSIAESNGHLHANCNGCDIGFME